MRYKSLTCTIAMSVGLLTAPLASADLKDGLVAHYPFDGNAQDASGNGNDGTEYGVIATVDRHGSSDAAMFFNGRSKIVIENPDILPQGEEFSINVWVKFDSLSADHTIVDKRRTSSIDNVLKIGINDDNAGLNFITINTNREATITTRPISLLNTNDWYMLTAMSSYKKNSFYINGVLIGTNTSSLPLNTSNANLWIGANYKPGDFNNFKGTLDDFRIYNRALSEDEIQTLYAGTTNGDCVHATYSPKKRTLTVPFVEMPVVDFLTGQPTGKMELWTGSLKQVLGTTNRFRLINKTVAQITDGSSSSCPATYAVETGTLSIPYIDVPTGIAVGNKEFENGVEVFKATMTWEPMGKSFVVQEVEQLP
jgi:hypothetical protein